MCIGRNTEIFDWGFESYVGVCQVEAGKWGAVGGFHSENGGGARRYSSQGRQVGKLQLCLPSSCRELDNLLH